MEHERIITRAHVLDTIIQILEEKKTEMTPSQITALVRSRNLLPRHAFQNEGIFKVISESYEKQEGIFYRSLKGIRKFGLQRWRVSAIKTALKEALARHEEFATQEAREIFDRIEVVGKKGYVHPVIRELIEDGEVERVEKGLYRVKKGGE